MNAQQRKRLIDERRTALEGRTYRLWCKDLWREFDVFRVPVEALLLNVDNRRFSAERKLVEEQIGRSLDPEANAADERIVISVLLDQNPQIDSDSPVGQPTPDTRALESDWLARRQETPFWIRPDGTVRNGNRRLAVIKRLQSIHGEEGQEWVDAIILDPKEIDEHELFKMEQREQLTENFKVNYTDINLLLTLRDAAIQEEIDWADSQDVDRVAGLLQRVAGGDKTYATIQLNAIRFMDAYLKDMNAEGQYHKLLRTVERFRDVGKNMTKIEEEFPDDASDMLRLAFAAIRSGLPHTDIRALRRMFIYDRARYQDLLQRVSNEEAEWERATEPQLLDPDLSGTSQSGPDQEEDDEESTEGPGPAVFNYPKDRVRSFIQNAIDAHRAAANLDVSAQLIQAWGRLEEVTDEQLERVLKNPSEETLEALRSIVSWADQAKRRLG